MNFSTLTPRTLMIIRYWLYVAFNTVFVTIGLYQAGKLYADGLAHNFENSAQIVYLSFYLGICLLLIFSTVQTTKRTIADLRYFNVTEQFQEWMDDSERKGERS